MEIVRKSVIPSIPGDLYRRSPEAVGELVRTASGVKEEILIEQGSPLLKRLANLFALLQERGRG